MSIKLHLALEDAVEAQVIFRCPGCKHEHSLRVKGLGPCWVWNGSMETPTFIPSILVQAFSDKSVRCHSFVTDGKIQFLADCTHELRGQMVDLPNWEEGVSYANQ